MDPSLKFLHLEDDRKDVELAQATLEAEGIEYETVIAENRDQFVAALEEGGFDLIISDYALPSFDGMTALALTRGKYPYLPFIFFSGQMGEERAIDSLKSGATDYVLKSRLSRLVPAVRRALQEDKERRAHLQAEMERKKLEEQLLQSQKMEAVGQLSSGIAHDLNNILTVIIGYSTLIEMGMDVHDSKREKLGQILEAANRAAELTKSLLAFSRKQIINPHPVDLNQIICKTEKFMKRIIPEDIDFRISFKKEVLIVNADSGQIQQVLINLVTNARDAMPTGGLLFIEMDTVAMDDNYINVHGFGEPGTYAVITLSDTGEGMDPAISKKVFEPFFTTKEVGKGTGLGLSIVYGIIKQHKGFINVYSEPDNGTTFKIYLPLTHAAVESTLKSKEEFLQGGKETILVVDDDYSLRELLGKTLIQFGYTVITASDGIDAVAKFREKQTSITLVILDIILPRMNGKEVYDEIRKINPSVKAIFMSGYPSGIIHKRGLLDQSLEFIPKPLNPRQLLVKVRNVLDGTHLSS